MMDPEFGEKVAADNMIATMLRTAPPMSSTEAAVVLAESYETTYSIFHHTENTGTMEPVMMHPVENVSGHSRLYERIRSVIREDVHKHTGLSLEEFFNLPRDINQVILDECVKKNKRESAALPPTPPGPKGKP